MEVFIEKAREFYKKHTRHIDDMIVKGMDAYYLKQTDVFGYTPSDEDLENPMLWKSEHWMWFSKNHGME